MLGIGIVLAYDITEGASFEEVKNYHQFISSKNNNSKIMILGNKLDMELKREVNKETALEYCKNFNCDYMEVSALSGENIHESFECLTRKIILNLEKVFLQVVLVVKEFGFIIFYGLKYLFIRKIINR